MNPTDEGSRHSAAERLWRLIINETRLASERTSFFLLANSFLLTAFALLRQKPNAGIQFVPLAVGMVFTFLHFININYGEKAMEVWQDLLQGETESGQDILATCRGRLQDIWWLKRPWPGRLTQNVASWLFPLLLFAMWAALIVLESVKSLGCA